MADKSIDDLKKQFSELKKEYENLTKKPFTVISDASINNIKKANEAIKLVGDAIDSAKEKSSRWTETFADIQEELQAINDSIKGGNTALSLGEKALKNTQDIAQKLKYDQQDIGKLSLKELEKYKEKLQQQKNEINFQAEIIKKRYEQSRLDQKVLETGILTDKNGRQLNDYQLKVRARSLGLTIQQLKAENEILEAQKAGFPQIENTNDLLDSRIVKEKEINKLMGIGGAAIEGIDKALEELGFGKLGTALGIEEVKERMKKVAEEIQKAGGDANSFANKFKVLKAGISEAGSNLIKSLKDPLSATLFVVIEMIEAFKDVDQGAGKVAKNFGVSYKSALELKGEMNSIAGTSSDINITTSKLTESFLTLNNAFGTFASLSKETLVTFTKLTTQAGVSNEAATALTQTAILNNKTTEDTTKEYLGQVAAFKAQTGSAVNTKLVLEDISKISKATALTLGNTPEALAEAAVTARSLGLSLETVNSAAEQLLQFQSSIESELEAELLTGKDLNLEEARRAALNGDIATLAKEISKNIGTAADFGKMNVLQQEALAKSVGMTRESLAKTLADQEVLTKLKAKEGETAQEAFNRKVKEVGLEKAKKELGDEELASMYAGQNIQEKFAATMEKVKEIFISLAEPLLPVLEIFTDIFKIVGPIVGIIGKMVHYLAIAGKYVGIAVAGFYTLKFLGDSVYRTTVLTNVAKSLGLITDVQANNAKKAAVMLNREDLAGNKILNIYKGRTLMATLQNNIAEKLGLNTKNASLGLTIKESLIKAKDFVIDKGKLAVHYAINAAKAIGNTLASIGKAIAKSDLVVNIGRAAMTVISSLSSIPVIGWALGLVAAAGAIALGYKFLKGNDVVSGGYGKRTLMAPEGAIALNDKDTVIAGTDLDGKNKSKETSVGAPAPAAGPSIDITPLIEKMVAVEAVLQQILTKETNIYMDSTKVGTGMAMGTSKVQ